MGKLMISLNDETERRLREEIGKLYYGRIGGLSIFLETLVRNYFAKKKKRDGDQDGA